MTVIRFAVVGASGTVIYFLTTLGLVMLRPGFPPAAASLAGFALSLGFSYLGHANYTFRTVGKHGEQGWRFAVVSIGLSVALSLLFDRLVTKVGADPWLATIAMCLTYPPLSFILHTIWTFAPVRRRASSAGTAAAQAAARTPSAT